MEALWTIMGATRWQYRIKTQATGLYLAFGAHWGGFGQLGSAFLHSAFCLLPSLRGGLRPGCISIRNTENGTGHPLATLAVPWYHPGPTLVP